MIRLIQKFTLGQSGLQALQAANGLILIWWLSIPEFAVYAVFTGAMGFTSQIAGFGLGPALMACVGPRVNEPSVMGRYLYAALRLRLWILTATSPIGVSFLWYTGSKIEITGSQLVFLIACLLAANFFIAQTDLYQSPLQMNRALGRIFRWSWASESSRLLLTGLAYVTGYLSLSIVTFITVAGLAISFYGTRHEGNKLIKTPQFSCQNEQQELLHFTMPRLPNVIFGAFQGQIVILLAALFGSTGQIAAIGALGRLSRLLMFLSAFNQLVLGPGVAKLHPTALWQRVPRILGIAAIISMSIAASGFVFPEALVFILGQSYEDIYTVIWLVTLNAGISYLSGVAYTLVTYRRWIAWWTSLATIGGILAAQTLTIAFAPMDTLTGLLLIGTAATSARLLMFILTMATARYRPGWLRSADIAKSPTVACA
ncbi:MAG: hypothetical protein AAF662_10885 [Pseudomonadota bacterium]